MKVLSVNEAGGSNLGDHAIYQGIKALLLQKDFISVTQLQLSLLPTSRRVTSPMSGSIYSLAKRHRLLHFIFLHIRLLVYNFRRSNVVFKEVGSCDFVLFGGGSLIINNKCVFPINLFIISMICKLKAKKYGIAGVSARRIDSRIARFLIRRFIRGAEFVYVRDHSSIELCSNQYGISAKFMPDFALLVPTRNRETNTKYLAINIMGIQSHGFFSDKYKFDKYIESMIKFIEASVDYKVTIFTTGEDSDYGAARYVFDYFRNKYGSDLQLVIPSDLDKLLDVYRNNHFIFGTRLHSAILGLGNGNEVICFDWDDKVKGFFKSLSVGGALVSEDDDFFNSLQHAVAINRRDVREVDELLVKLTEKPHA